MGCNESFVTALYVTGVDAYTIQATHKEQNNIESVCPEILHVIVPGRY